MKKSVKSFLFSTFIFPGSGYFVVGQKLKGLVACTSVVIAIVVLYQQAMALARPIAEKIQSGAIPMDPDLIAVMLQQSLNESTSSILSVASWFIIGVWVVCSVDCVRLGRKIDSVEAKAS